MKGGMRGGSASAHCAVAGCEECGGLFVSGSVCGGGGSGA